MFNTHCVKLCILFLLNLIVLQNMIYKQLVPYCLNPCIDIHLTCKRQTFQSIHIYDWCINFAYSKKEANKCANKKKSKQIRYIKHVRILFHEFYFITFAEQQNSIACSVLRYGVCGVTVSLYGARSFTRACVSPRVII